MRAKKDLADQAERKRVRSSMLHFLQVSGTKKTYDSWDCKAKLAYLIAWHATFEKDTTEAGAACFANTTTEAMAKGDGELGDGSK